MTERERHLAMDEIEAAIEIAKERKLLIALAFLEDKLLLLKVSHTKSNVGYSFGDAFKGTPPEEVLSQLREKTKKKDIM